MSSNYGALSSDCEASTPLVPVTRDSRNEGNSVSGRNSFALFLSLGLAISAGVFLFVSDIGSAGRFPSLFDSANESTKKASGKTLLVSVSNEYGNYVANMFPYPFLEDGLLVEPHRETTFTIDNAVYGCNYKWSIDSTEYSYSGLSKGNSFSFVIEATSGEATLTIQESQCSSSRSLKQTIFLKYIRREVFTLTDKDRDEYLDALHTVYTVSTLEGQELYGDGYKSLNYFLIMHNDAVQSPVCDELHADVGFLINHIYLFMMVEQSMRLVNPRVSLHYIDIPELFSSPEFSVNHIRNQLDGGTWTELFSESWYGASDPMTGRILNGRWANLTVPRLTPDLMKSEGVNEGSSFWPKDVEVATSYGAPIHFSSPYGFVRPTYLWNPNEYLSRFHNVMMVEDVSGIVDAEIFANYGGVTCDTYDQLIAISKGLSFSQYLYSASDSPHGPMHYTFGGRGAGESAAGISIAFQEALDLDDAEIYELSVDVENFWVEYYDFTKYRYADDVSVMLDSPLNCTENPWQDGVLLSKYTAEPGLEGGPTCAWNDAYTGSESDYTSLIEAVFGTETESNITLKLMLKNFDERKELVDLLPNYFPYTSDLIASSSPYDPIFWSMHQHIEKLYQYMIFKGWFSDYTFERRTTGQCSGHTPDDTVTWLRGLQFSDPSVDSSNITLVSLAAGSLPDGDMYEKMIPYVYDSNTFPVCNTTVWEDF